MAHSSPGSPPRFLEFPPFPTCLGGEFPLSFPSPFHTPHAVLIHPCTDSFPHGSPHSAEIKDLQAQSQAAGENGDVDASMAMQKQAETLLAQKDALENPQFPGKEKVGHFFILVPGMVQASDVYIVISGSRLCDGV